MKKLVIIAVLFFLFSNKTKAIDQRAGSKKFLAKFNVLRPFTDQFILLLKEKGFEFSEVYDANKNFENQPLDKVTFYVLDSQLVELDKLKTIEQIEYISLLVIE